MRSHLPKRTEHPPRKGHAPTRPRSDRAQQSGSAACLSIAYFVIALVALHVLKADFRPARHMISDYAVGSYGWLMTTAFVALSICCFALMIGLFSSGPRSVLARIGATLFGIASCGLIVTAVFPTDLPGAPATRAGDIHNATFLVNVGSLLLATIVLTASFARDERWRPLARPALTLDLLVVIAIVLQFLTLRPGAPYGLANRFFVVTLMSWLTVVALHLRAAGPTAHQATRPAA